MNCRWLNFRVAHCAKTTAPTEDKTKPYRLRQLSCNIHQRRGMGPLAGGLRTGPASQYSSRAQPGQRRVLHSDRPRLSSVHTSPAAASSRHCSGTWFLKLYDCSSLRICVPPQNPFQISTESKCLINSCFETFISFLVYLVFKTGAHLAQAGLKHSTQLRVSEA